MTEQVLEPLEAAPEGLDQTASEPEIVRWVARNIDNPNPRPMDCPDPFAWTLLRQCRDDAGFCKSFIEKLWAKMIPSRAQLDTDKATDLDGGPTLDLIDRIQAMRAEAEAKSPVQITRQPEQKPVPDAFADLAQEDLA